MESRCIALITVTIRVSLSILYLRRFRSVILNYDIALSSKIGFI